jgi:hypothetical protein
VLAVLSILAFFAIVIGILYVLLAFKVKGIAGKLAPKAG